MRAVLVIGLQALLLALTLTLQACVTTDEQGAMLQQQGPDLKHASALNTQLGFDYLRRGRLELALEKLNRAVEQDSRNGDAYLGLALVQDQRGDAGEAERNYRKAIALKRDDPVIQNNFAIFLCRSGKRAEAERYFLQAAANIDYRSPEAAYTNAGVCALQSGDSAGAEAMLRRALEVNPRHGEALVQMARLSMQNQDYLRARAFIQRYELLGQSTPTVLLMAAQTEHALGDRVAADRYARQLRQKYPDAPEVNQLPH